MKVIKAFKTWISQPNSTSPLVSYILMFLALMFIITLTLWLSHTGENPEKEDVIYSYMRGLQYSNGLKKNYYDTGQLHFEFNFKNGVLDGISKEYYKNGNIKSLYAFSHELLLRKEIYKDNGDLLTVMEIYQPIRGIRRNKGIVP